MLSDHPLIVSLCAAQRRAARVTLMTVLFQSNRSTTFLHPCFLDGQPLIALKKKPSVHSSTQGEDDEARLLNPEEEPLNICFLFFSFLFFSTYTKGMLVCETGERLSNSLSGLFKFDIEKEEI